MTLEDEHIYSVTELNGLTRQLIENSLGCVWVSGEISNFIRASSGHLYFSLKDSQAQIRCALFRMNGRRLNFKPKNGQQVIALAQVSLYEARGDFQLIVEHLEESGDGALQKAFEALKKKLYQAGLFDEAHKKPLPLIPKKIGVITSPSGAAIRDILIVLKRRFPTIPVVIYPSLVQGQQAAKQLVQAIEIANRRQECDVLILSRGGGSLEDLWPFNEEIVARAIYASHIPIVSGVGHEIDFTIADFVADVRTATPSAAAERVSPDQQEWQQKLQQLQNRLTHLMVSYLQKQKTQLAHITQRLRHPKERLQEQAQHLDQLERRLQLAQHHLLEQQKQRLQQIARALQALSPLNTLERGYAIVSHQPSGQVVSNINQLKTNDELLIKLANGRCECVVERIVSP